MNSVLQLNQTIESLQQDGKVVKVTVLKSQIKTNRKSLWTIKSKSKGSTKL